jgi:hypothetical protein
MGHSGRLARADSSRPDCPDYALRNSKSARDAEVTQVGSRLRDGRGVREMNPEERAIPGPSCAPMMGFSPRVYVAIYVAISVPNRAGTCRSVPLALEQACCFTRESGAPGGIRTPDHLIRSPLPVGASRERDSCVDNGPVRLRRRRFRGESGSRPGESLRPIA